ncbi:DUF4369 domain-containing protein [Saccharicrinis fermentans]|uniref:DUF4369 domain-containing protein n=1 Tax=Saccharicrinis fermentans DSM 9555 = JCM 21142 TaxID=869213 RepID=W7YGK0_9BACT|nr:DUF4369 domain-containing protein [Saccharicrinis fermentans]GAF01734.1 hypothetical protein JCM21142_348 [Saccharicrinis fermentans DSM 9555 = JCM 21142]
MGKLSYIFAALLVIIVSCSEKKVKQIPLIEGQISNYSGHKAYLYADETPDIPLDTIEMDANGTFSVAKQCIEKAGFYYLRLENGGRINFFLRPSDYIHFQADAKHLLETCQSNNSKLLSNYWSLEKINLNFNTGLKEISTKLSQMGGQEPNDSLYKALHTQRNKLAQQLRDKCLKISEQANSPIIDFIMLNIKAGNQSLFSMKSDLQLFVDNAEQLTNDEQTQALFADYDKKIMQAYSLIRAQGYYQKGEQFPELRARTNWNEALQLNTVHGNPIHIILWSGEDLRDEAKLKQSKAMMYRYGSKGLKTIMIAYTNNKNKWLSNIKKHRLPYWHLVDTLSLQSPDLPKIGVRSLPCNFVIDSIGTIINRDIWGQELELTIRSNIEK